MKLQIKMTCRIKIQKAMKHVYIFHSFLGLNSENHFLTCEEHTQTMSPVKMCVELRPKKL